MPKNLMSAICSTYLSINQVPKGYVRFLGKLAELTDNGIEIHFFTEITIFDFRLPENEIG